MTPEIWNFQEKLWLNNYSPEQIDKITNELKNKIDTLKKDGSFSGEDLNQLVDLLDDKTILSPTEAELKSHLEELKNLEDQVDFLLKLVEIKKSLWEEKATEETPKENTEEKPTEENSKEKESWFRRRNKDESESNNGWLNKWLNNDKPKNTESKNSEKNYNNETINPGDSENVKKLKELCNTKNPKDENEKKEVWYLKRIITSIDYIEAKTKDDNSNVYIKDKLNSINKILEKIFKDKSVSDFDVKWILIERADIEYELGIENDEWQWKEWRELYNLPISRIENIADAQALLEYTNRNFTEIDEKWMRPGEDSLASLDNEDEILNFQKRVIKFIQKNYNVEWFTYQVKYEEWKWYVWKAIEISEGKILWKKEVYLTKNENYLEEVFNWTYENKQTKETINFDAENIKNFKNKKVSEITHMEFLSAYTKIKDPTDKIIDKIIEVSQRPDIKWINLQLLNMSMFDKIIESDKAIIENVDTYWLPINKELIEKWVVWKIFKRFSSNETLINNLSQKVFSVMNFKEFLEKDKTAKDLYEGNPKIKEIFDRYINKESERINSKEDLIKYLNAIKKEPSFDSQRKYEEIIKLWRIVPSDLAYTDEFIDILLNNVNFKEKGRHISSFYNLGADLKWTIKVLTKILDKHNFNYSDEQNDSLSFLRELNILTWSEAEKIMSILYKNDFKNINWLSDNERRIYKVIRENVSDLILFDNSKELKSKIENTDISKLDDKLLDELKEIFKNTEKEKLKELMEKIKEVDIKNIPHLLLYFKKNHSIDGFDKFQDNFKDSDFKKEALALKWDIIKILSILGDIKKEETNKNEEKAKDIWVDLWEKDYENFNKSLKEKYEELKKDKSLTEEQRKQKLEEYKKFLAEKVIEAKIKWKDISEEGKQEAINILLKNLKNTEYVKEANIAKNNITVFLDASSKWKSILEYAKENKIALKDEKWNIINATEIWINAVSNSVKIKDREVSIKDYSFNKENGTLKTPNWENLKLSPDEQKLIKEHPEKIQDIVNLYETLERTWLKKLWDYKDDIFKSISNAFTWVQFNKNDWDYVSSRETKVLLNAILVSVWEKTIDMNLPLENFIVNIENINGKQLWWVEKSVNNLWDTYLEAKFIEKFVPRNDSMWFKQFDFESALKWK